ncbi:MAG: histidine phosphatase family protein [Ruminococcaceae bacterium]|nr:histidine phosphatase family protein [Oscillospiraceae bacterium]MBE6707218.1 histidine phosphatase family protein [Oscillospiraceae bacterium]
MRLILIRHAEPNYEIDSLTERGFIEAQALSKRISRLDVTAFYCSPLGRAQRTAEPILKAMGRSAETLDWLREFSPKVKKPWKEKEGCAWDWLPGVWCERDNFYERDGWYREQEFLDASVKEAYDEVTEGLDRLLARHGYERHGGYYKAVKPNRDTIVLFCHFGVMAVMLSHLFGVSPMTLWHGTCALPSSVTILDTEERREGIAYFRMNAFGDTSHLYANGIEPSFAARFCETYDSDERHD